MTGIASVRYIMMYAYNRHLADRGVPRNWADSTVLKMLISEGWLGYIDTSLGGGEYPLTRRGLQEVELAWAVGWD